MTIGHDDPSYVDQYLSKTILYRWREDMYNDSSETDHISNRNGNVSDLLSEQTIESRLR